MKLSSKLYVTLGLIGSIVDALPIHHDHENHKREIITRMHTASAQTVTDFYSTTTNVIVAPTVEFIVSGTATYTTTLIPDGVDATVQPAATLTTTLPAKQVEFVSSPDAIIPTSSTTSNAAAATTTTTPDVTTSQQKSTQQTTQQQSTLQSSSQSTSIEETTTLSPSSSTNNAQNIETTTVSQEQSTTSGSSVTYVSAIGNSEVSATAVTQPAAQVHTTVSASSTISSSSGNVQATTSTTTSTSSSSTTSATSSSSVASTGIPLAVTYSPYNSDGTCRSSDSVYSDLQLIKSKGVSQVRIYGTDCNSLQTVQPACAELGIKINQGFWISSAGVDSIDDSVSDLIAYGQASGWDIFEYITIGNEAINSGYCSVSDLISKIASVKAQLNSAGYSGQVTTSEPPVSFTNNPELCTESAIDFVGINPHSYFDASIDASEAGSFVKGQVALTQSTCGSKNIVVTETGYPSQGDTNGLNVPSSENQQIAVQSILDELDQQVTILSYFDDLWKAPGSYGIEQSFGIESFMP